MGDRIDQRSGETGRGRGLSKRKMEGGEKKVALSHNKKKREDIL